MAYGARVVLDSVSPAGVRLTTMEVTFPRFVLAEFNTHRVFSRNSASSRAIPTSKILERVANDPVLPVEWGRNMQGMSAAESLSEEDEVQAKRIWLEARDRAVASVREMLELKVHKQVINRLLEPFTWHTVIVTATEWSNFFALRCHKNAQPELRVAAEMMRSELVASTPQAVALNAWHLPLIQDDEHDLDLDTLKKVSAARCARVSYLTHAGQREIDKDIELCERLRGDGHLSPFEHVATPSDIASFQANLRGWIQMRREIEVTLPSVLKLS